MFNIFEVDMGGGRKPYLSNSLKTLSLKKLLMPKMSIYVKMDHLTRIAGKNIYFIDTMSFPHSQAPQTYVCPLAYANVIFDH